MKDTFMNKLGRVAQTYAKLQKSKKKAKIMPSIESVKKEKKNDALSVAERLLDEREMDGNKFIRRSI